MRQLLLIPLLFALLAACRPIPEQMVEVPTLAVIPTITPQPTFTDTATPTDTPSPTDTPTA
ncbi:MAG: hypothetical protein AAFR56_18530, partial [Chloroflexota bacterium]